MLTMYTLVMSKRSFKFSCSLVVDVESLTVVVGAGCGTPSASLAVKTSTTENSDKATFTNAIDEEF